MVIKLLVRLIICKLRGHKFQIIGAKIGSSDVWPIIAHNCFVNCHVHPEVTIEQCSRCGKIHTRNHHERTELKFTLDQNVTRAEDSSAAR